MAETDKTRALELLAQGLTSEEIAERLGVSKGTVAAWKAHVTMATYDNTAAARPYGRFVVIREPAN